MIVLEDVDSTNNWIKQNLFKLKDYDAVVAKKQNAGRGRLGRKWDSGITGNLYFSFVLKNTDWLNMPTHLSILVPVTVRRALSARISDNKIIKLKWPNDLIAGNGKLGGILIEKIDGSFVVGIGINIIDSPRIEDLKTSCLADFADIRSLRPEDIAANIINDLKKAEGEYKKFGFDKIKDEWLKYCVHVDKEISIDGNERVIFIGIGPSGEGIVKDLGTGAERSIFYGDIGIFLS